MSWSAVDGINEKDHSDTFTACAELLSSHVDKLISGALSLEWMFDDLFNKLRCRTRLDILLK